MNAANRKRTRKILLIVLVFLFIFSVAFALGGVSRNAYAASAGNIALNKPVSSTGRSGEDTITDGRMDGYWEAEPYPAMYEIDLEAVYDVTSVRVYPFSDGGRYYHYSIYYSLNGRDYSLFAQKSDSSPETSDGTAYDAPGGSVVARYIRVEMTYNISNTAVHMRETEVFGTLNETYTDEIPQTDPNDPQNVAYGKKTYSNFTGMASAVLTDGSLTSVWMTRYAPMYADIDLGENYLISDIVLFFPEGEGYFNYTVYGSCDGDRYERIYRKNNSDMPAADGDVIDAGDSEYRFIRVYMQYQYGCNNVCLSEVRVHGTATGENTGELRDGGIEEILDVQPFEQTEYAKPITQDETIANVYGIIERNVGKLYCGWFEFELAESENGNDYFELSDAANGKIHIKANSGVTLASGVNYYFKHFANVNITEQADQTLMPTSIVRVGSKIYRETPYSVRYAFNYCTMDYSFAFYDEEDWQKEYDWLALNGVTLVLDLTGQEAVWISFLMNFGYSYDEAKAWLCGPAYYAWQFMDNMEIYGGGVPDGWVRERLESARRMQRWRLSLGMQTCLQGYAGIVPKNFSDYSPDTPILDQGTWCGQDRPDMVRTDGTEYDEFSRLFYEAQEWAFGATSDYYAVDPFHEGGIRPSDLSDKVIAEQVLESLLEYDADGVWVIQAWHSNPSNDLLHGLGENKDDHALILDLCAVEAPKWNRTKYGEDGEGGMVIDEIEFNSTPWVWCSLENYGGNPSMDGELQNMIDQLTLARESAHYLRGIGMISEASLDNPAVYNMLFDMAWESFTAEEWLESYVTARYGRYSEGAQEAWKILNDTVYSKPGWYRTSPQVMTLMPETAAKQEVPYDNAQLQKALCLLLEDFDVLCVSEGYRYDLVELMRQIVNNYSVEVFNDMLTAYETLSVGQFKNLKTRFLSTFDLMDAVLGCRPEWLAGEWIGKAQDWGEAIGNDFAADMFAGNAMTLITSWADLMTMRAITDYAQRTYQGMLIDVYKARWEVYLDKLENNLETGADVVGLSTDDYYHFYRQWVMSGKEYSREANEGYEYLWNIAERVLTETESETAARANSHGNVLLEELIARAELADRTLYSEEQLARLDAAVAQARELAGKTLTRSEYLAAVESLHGAITAEIANSSEEATVVPPGQDDPAPSAPSGNNGLVIGLSVGGAVLVLAAAGIILVIVRRKKKN